MQYIIDATGKKLGRVSSEAAAILRGKRDTGFAPNNVTSDTVIIENASKIELSERRLEDEGYNTYSGYPGGLRHETRGHLLARRGMKEVLTRTIRGMLPRNKLRDQMLKNLTIKN
ncbi:MAG: 50S ribosomal protein L13 [bacterium]|jgi:large subunit ribosomal protein L13